MKVESFVSDERGLYEGLGILDLKPSGSCSERKVFGAIQDFLDGDGAHNKVLGFIHKEANLAFWFGTVSSVAAGEVEGKLALPAMCCRLTWYWSSKRTSRVD